MAVSEAPENERAKIERVSLERGRCPGNPARSVDDLLAQLEQQCAVVVEIGLFAEQPLEDRRA